MNAITSRDPKGRQVTNIFAAAFDKALLDHEAAQRLGESSGFATYLADGIRKFSAQAPLDTELLSTADSIPAGRLQKPFTFETRKGLYVHMDGPMRQVLADGNTIEPQDVAAMTGFDLLKNASDKRITSGIGAAYEVVLAQIAAAIEVQWGGKPGPLLTNGYANIFYVRGLAVNVRWRADGGRWLVCAWQFGEVDWRAEGRVFSGN